MANHPNRSKRKKIMAQLTKEERERANAAVRQLTNRMTTEGKTLQQIADADKEAALQRMKDRQANG